MSTHKISKNTTRLPMFTHRRRDGELLCVKLFQTQQYIINRKISKDFNIGEEEERLL